LAGGELPGGLVEQLPLAAEQAGVDLQLSGVTAEAEAAPPEWADGEVRLGDGAVQQPGLLGDGFLEHGVAPP
jgi:hypothetical protein